MRQRLRAFGLFALAIVAITCTDAPTSPTKVKPSTSGVANIRMSPSFTPEAARIFSGLAAFGTEVTEVHVVLTGPDGSKKDTVIAFPVSQSQITIEIPVPSSGTDQAFDALIELRNDQHVVLFSGHQIVIARGANLPPQTPPLVIITYTGPGKGTKTVTVAPSDTTIAGLATVAIRASAVDSAGLPVPNLLVKFAVSDATLAVATSTGDATGTLTSLGKRGVATVSAITPTGISGSSRITFVPPAARVVVISGNGQTGVAGSALAQPLVVEVQATDNLPVPGAAVTFRAVTAGGSVQQATAFADANGRATSTLTLGRTAGAYVYEAGSGTLAPASVTATATAAPAAAVAIVSGDAQTDTVGRVLLQPLVVKVTDQFGGPAAGASVSWTRIAGNGTPGASGTTTAADGTSSITYMLGATASTDTIRASVQGVAQSVLFSARAVNRGAAAITIISGGNQAGLPNATLPTPLVARVSDSQNNPIANAIVTWSAAGAGATFSPISSASDALGQVTTQATLGATPGSTTVTAAVGTLTTTTTLTTSGGGGQTTLAIVAGDQQSAVAGATVPVAPSVVLKDGSGNPVANAQVVFTVASGGGTITGGTATTNVSGIATLGSWTLGTIPGPNTLKATSGSLSVTFTATGTAIVPPTATRLLITTQPSATAVSGAAFAQQPVVQLADANGNPVSVAGVVVTATFANGPTTPTPVLNNATATTNASGQATFAGLGITGPFGNYTLQFATPNITAATSNTIAVGAGPANTLLLFGGNGQNAPVSTAVAVPPLAKVIDAQSNGVPGVAVTFNAVTAGSTVSDGTTTGTTVTITTNSLGIAQPTAWTMSATAGPHSLTASASVPNGSPVTFTANATAGGASKFILVQPLPAQIVVGAAVPPINIQIADANNNPVAQANVSVSLAGIVQPSGIAFNVTLQTNAQGIASFTLSPYVGTIGNEVFTISGSGFTTITSSPVPVVAGSAAALLLTTQPSSTAQSGVVFAQQPVVQVVDVGTNAVSATNVPVTAVAPTGTLSGTVVVNTNASGRAAFTNLALTVATGTYQLNFTSPSLTTATSNGIAISVGPAAGITILAGDNQTVVAGGFVPVLPAVVVKDAAGNPVAGVDVLFTAVTPGSFIDDVTSTTITTNAQGVAQATSFWMLSPTAGPNTLTASAPGVPGSPVTFHGTGTAGTAANMQLLQAVPASITVGQPFPAPVQVQLVDQNNNAVAQGGVTITATANVQPSNTTFALNATTASNGIATFNPPPYAGKIGTMIFTLTATNISTLVTPGINVLTGAASKLIIATQPSPSASSGVPFATQPAVQITDVGANPVSTTANVTAVIASGTGTLGGTTTIASNASGLATFNNLVLSGAPGPFTLGFQSGALTAAVSNTITLGAGGPAAIVIVAGNGQVAAAGSAVPVAPAVRVNDGSGTPLPGITVNFAVTFGGGAVNPLSAVTNASGIATVSSWTLGTSVGSQNLTASVGTLSQTFAATAVAGPANKLGLVTPPSATAASGSPLAQQPAVQRQDQFGNPVQGAGVVVTATILTGTGSLTNATATTTAGGLATFSGLTITGAAGPITLDFTSPGVTHIASGTITLGGGSAAVINKTAGDNQTAAAGTNVAVKPSVLVTDGAGNPVAGVAVTFAPTLGGGSTPPGSVLTNASGIATAASWQLGTSVGTNNLTASAGALSTTFTATAVAGPAAQFAFVTAPPTTATSGAPLSPQPSVQLQDNFGNPVATSGLLVTASILSGSGTLTNATASTNAAGLATFTGLTISGAAGSVTLQFGNGTLTHAVSAPIALSGGTAAAIAKNAGDLQTATVATNVATAPSVKVTDGAGNPVAGAQVTFTVSAGNGAVTASLATTNVSGIATVGSWQLGNIAGGNSLTATLGALTTTFTATGVAAAPAALSITTQPTTSTSGLALSPQPVIQVRDQFGNATSASGTVTAVIISGIGTLNNATTGIGTGGVATFGALTINGSGTFTLQFQSGSLTPVSSAPITQAAGPAVGIAFSVSPTGGTGGVPFSPAVTVRLVDAQSNTVTSNNTNTVTLSIAPGTGTPGATLAGAGPVTFVNGVATFPAAAIDFGGTNYFLRANTNALTQAGAPIPFTSSNTFSVTPGPSQFLTTKPGTRVSVAGVGAQNPPTVTRPIFIARNAQGNPAPGLTVSVTAFGRCRLDTGNGLFTTLSFTSDVNGEVTPLVRLPSFADGSGCLIKASGPTFTTATDSSQIAVYPAQTSHVWTGAANSNWQNAANWIPVISVPSVPSSTSDNVFIPNYNPQSIPVLPVVSGPKPAMNRLTLDSLAQISLGNIGIDIGSGGVAGWGLTNSGSIHIAATATVNGIFDILDAGQSGLCGTVAAQIISLRDVSANVLNVRCRTNIDTTAVVANTVNVFPNGGSGLLLLTSGRAGLAVSGNANFTGDSLSVSSGVINVAGTATFGGAVGWFGGTLSTGSNAVFASNHALYNSTQMILQGDVTFGGPNAGNQQLVGGQMTLLGNFTQVTGIIGGPGGLTFNTSSDHVSVFAGSATQTVSFANSAQSKFSVLRLQNTSAGGVQLTTNAQIVNGTTQPRVDIITGRLQLNSGTIFTVNSGGLRLGLNTNLNLLGNITGVISCTGRTTNSATITGSGLYNGAAYTASTCTP